ncbi:MARVEL domain-containing protein 3-like isoform X1 [Turdus rufiventris]|nr:MARVEL domain-containing protein 3-like isoform X1 [Turdus rufiventris]
MGCDMGTSDLCVTSPATGVQVSKSGSHTPPGLPLGPAGPRGMWSAKEAEGEGKPKWRMVDMEYSGGILKFVEIAVNLLVLICVGASQASVSGFTSLGGFGSLNWGYSPFEGTELQEVRELDMQFTQMRAPCVYGGVVFSLTAATLTLVFLVVGAKPIQQLRTGLLVGECAFSLLAGLAYLAAVGLYLHFVRQVNATEVCKRRERLYASRGYTSMNCDVQGGDAAVGLFGVVASCLYFASFVVCILAIRTVRAFQSRTAKAQHSPEGSIRDRSIRSHHAMHRTSESSHSVQALATLV